MVTDASAALTLSPHDLAQIVQHMHRLRQLDGWSRGAYLYVLDSTDQMPSWMLSSVSHPDGIGGLALDLTCARLVLTGAVCPFLIGAMAVVCSARVPAMRRFVGELPLNAKSQMESRKMEELRQMTAWSDAVWQRLLRGFDDMCISDNYMGMCSMIGRVLKRKPGLVTSETDLESVSEDESDEAAGCGRC
ncbi:unnamed protein product [Symbiodinium microadriaticum]|nr:unnamed protein product [Symbiodinium microadriaticum]